MKTTRGADGATVYWCPTCDKQHATMTAAVLCSIADEDGERGSPEEG